MALMQGVCVAQVEYCGVNIENIKGEEGQNVAAGVEGEEGEQEENVKN